MTKRKTTINLERASGNIVQDLEACSTELTIGYAFLLLIAGDPCKCIQEWGNSDSLNEIFDRLVCNVKQPKALIKTQKKENVFIGTKYYRKLSQTIWDVTKTIAKVISVAYAKITLGLLKKFNQGPLVVFNNYLWRVENVPQNRKIDFYIFQT